MVAGSGLEKQVPPFSQKARELFSRVYTGYPVRMTIGKAGFVGQPRMRSQMKLSDALWLPEAEGLGDPGPAALGRFSGFGTRLCRRWKHGSAKGGPGLPRPKWAVKAPEGAGALRSGLGGKCNKGLKAAGRIGGRRSCCIHTTARAQARAAERGQPEPSRLRGLGGPPPATLPAPPPTRRT